MFGLTCRWRGTATASKVCWRRSLSKHLLRPRRDHPGRRSSRKPAKETSNISSSPGVRHSHQRRRLGRHCRWVIYWVSHSSRRVSPSDDGMSFDAFPINTPAAFKLCSIEQRPDSQPLRPYYLMINHLSCMTMRNSNQKGVSVVKSFFHLWQDFDLYPGSDRSSEVLLRHPIDVHSSGYQAAYSIESAYGALALSLEIIAVNLALRISGIRDLLTNQANRLAISRLTGVGRVQTNNGVKTGYHSSLHAICAFRTPAKSPGYFR